MKVRPVRPRTSRVTGRVFNIMAVGFFMAASAAMLSQTPGRSQSQDPVVVMQTTKGPITMRIYYGLVPYTAGNFLDLVQQGFYNGLTFHRVENWVVQGGDPNGNGTGQYVDPQTGQPRYLRLETHRALSQRQGAVCMARGNDRNSASCQFYILKSNMPQLNGQYAVFGQVLDGMQAVYNMRIGDRIVSASVAQQSGSSGDSGSQSSQPSSSDSYQGGPPPKTIDSGF